MMIKITITPELTEDAINIRREVFVIEQGFTHEFDDIDQLALHFVLYKNNEAAGCCRLFPSKNHSSYIVGRLAVRKQFRGHQIGRLLLLEAEKELLKRKINKIELSAQVRVRSFYEQLGYVATGDEYFDEFCPHIHMEKKLTSPIS